MAECGFSFVIVCKGRLAHLKQSLPVIVQQKPDEIVVVDYDCPDGAGKWVRDNYPDTHVVFERDPKGFSLARARNIGARDCGSRYLVFVDADVKLHPDFLHWLKANVRDGTIYTCLNSPEHSKKGSFCCAKNDFSAAGGYDEAIRAWGGEDTDLYARLIHLGAGVDYFPDGLISTIPHTNVHRTEHYRVKCLSQSNAITRIYISLKHHMMRKGMIFDLAEREYIFQEIIAQHKELSRDRFIELSIAANQANADATSVVIGNFRRFGLFGAPLPYVRIAKGRFERLRRLFAADLARQARVAPREILQIPPCHNGLGNRSSP